MSPRRRTRTAADAPGTRPGRTLPFRPRMAAHTRSRSRHTPWRHAGVVGWYSFLPMFIDAKADLRDFLRILEPDTGTGPLVRDEGTALAFNELGYLAPPISTQRVILAADVIDMGGGAGIDALDVALSHPLPGARLLAARAANHALLNWRADVGAIFEVLRLHEFDPDPRVAAEIEYAMFGPLKFKCP